MNSILVKSADLCPWECFIYLFIFKRYNIISQEPLRLVCHTAEVTSKLRATIQFVCAAVSQTRFLFASQGTFHSYPSMYQDIVFSWNGNFHSTVFFVGKHIQSLAYLLTQHEAK